MKAFLPVAICFSLHMSVIQAPSLSWTHAPCILDNHEQLHDLGEDLVEGGDDVAVVRLLHLQLILVSGRVVELHATAEQAKMNKHTSE